MQLQLLTIALAAVAVATPTLQRRATLCPAGQNAVCCQLDVDGIADLTCSTVPGSPKSKKGFAKACAADGLTSMCCVLFVDGTGAVCNTP